MIWQSVLIGVVSGLIASELHLHRRRIEHYVHMWISRKSPQADILREAIVCLYLEPWKAEVCLQRIVRIIDPHVSRVLIDESADAAYTLVVGHEE